MRGNLTVHLIALGVLLGGMAWPAADAAAWQAARYEAERRRLVEEDIVGAGIENPRVIQAMLATPRHEFVPPAQRRHAYFDMALPIGDSQTISPPFVVAYMTEQLDPQPDDVVLEIGTGSGYQAAVLSPLVREVYSIEIVEPLGRRAAQTLRRLGYANVFAKVGDGYQGWPEHAPFDKIIVTCSPEDVPQALVDQLKEGGRMVVPLGERYQQLLYLFTKRDGELVREALRPTLFVPMTGEAEARRQLQPDPLRPEVANASFEELAGEDSAAAGWHYQRQLEVIEEPGLPHGDRFARFSNDVAGRPSQALQGFALDGSKVRALDVSAWVRLRDVRPGPEPDQLAALVLIYYDENRAPVGSAWLGPWQGTFDWRQYGRRLQVPPKAREAILRVGLLGATGQIDVDQIELAPATHRNTRWQDSRIGF